MKLEKNTLAYIAGILPIVLVILLANFAAYNVDAVLWLLIIVLAAAGIAYIKPKGRTALYNFILLNTFTILYFNEFNFFTEQWTALVLINMATLVYLIHIDVIDKRHVFTSIIIILLITTMGTFYLNPAINMARGQGTVLTPNWHTGLNWIKDNTAECATIATYWDPGHFIRTIANRPVVFDGANQNAKLQYNSTTEEPGLHIQEHEYGISRMILHEDGVTTTARIQDIATVMLTTNETLALDILSKYVREDCDELYFIASADLIGKSLWWTYFPTWAPDKQGSCGNLGAEARGDCYFYNVIQLSSASPVENSVVYSYPLDAQRAFLLRYTEESDTYEGFLQQGNNLASVSDIFYFTREQNGVITSNPSADITGLVFVNPDRNTIIFIPEELKDSLFTRMFFFNGSGMENFEFIQDWGNELKLFKVNF